ncbi:MAG: MBG domain-containing protein, partial [Acidobacteriota bacterium]
ATPAVNVSGGTFTFNGEPHGATGSVTGVGGANLGAPTFTYNGAPDVPVNAGMYHVVASFAGNANYAPASTNTAVIEITPAAATLALTNLMHMFDTTPKAAGVTTTPGGLVGVSITYDGSPTPPTNAGSYAVVATLTHQNYTSAAANGTLVIGKATPAAAWSAPAPIIVGTPLGAAQLNATSSVPGTFTYSPVAGTVLDVGPGQTLSATFTPADADNYNSVPVSTSISVLYSTAACQGAAGHAILPPVNADGTSVYKRNSTVPAKFRVCDAAGNSVGTPGVVAGFYLIQVINGTVSTTANETVESTTPDTTFRWDTTGQQWIFNIATKNLSIGRTYVYRIALKDGSAIQFQYGLR